jgi:hypothetical protein
MEDAPLDNSSAHRDHLRRGTGCLENVTVMSLQFCREARHPASGPAAPVQREIGQLQLFSVGNLGRWDEMNGLLCAE